MEDGTRTHDPWIHNPGTKSRNPQDTKDLREAASAGVPVLVPTPPEADLGADLPPELKRVAGVWNELPEVIRVAILAMVRSMQK